LASSLWLNGTLVGTTTATNLSGYSISQLALRESNNNTEGTIGVDNLTVATTFDEAAAVPEPSTVLLAVVGMVGLLGFRRRRS